MTPTHNIAWAYPTSPAATKHGHGKTGCYIVTVGGKHHAAVLTRDEALAAVASTGSEPDYWSVDHPRHVAEKRLTPLERELLAALREAEHYLKFSEQADVPHMQRISAVIRKAEGMAT